MSAFSGFPLFCHPASPCTAVQAVEATATLSDEGLLLRYFIHAQAGAIRLPEPRPAQAADGLWQHTCCEAFIAPAGSTEYREFNFSPSGQWAAYRFSDYRARDFDFTVQIAPQIELRQHAGGFELTATLAPDLLPAAARLHLGLTVVIEAADGSKSYWALAHAATQPDFHLRQSFSLALSASRT